MTKSEVGLMKPVERLQDEKPLPLDPKILTGIALQGVLTSEELEAVRDRLNTAFQQVRGDMSREYSDCIAYGVGLTPASEQLLDGHLQETAMTQNHGMLPDPSAETMRVIWAGQEGDKKYVLRKACASLVLNNGEVPDGIIYSLSAANKDHL